MQGVAGDGRPADDGLLLPRHQRPRPCPGVRGSFALAGTAPALAGCSGPGSVVDPAGPAAREIATLWWWMLGYGAFAWLIVVALWCLASRRRPVPQDDGAQRRVATRWIWGGGVAWPLVSIAVLLAFGIPAGRTPADGRAAALRVEVTAYRWGWDVHYPDVGRRLDGELVVPVGRLVAVEVRTRDVIHGFWVPRLGARVDAVPGRVQRVRLRADEPGVFHAPCAEFCGTGHAHMSLRVRAIPAAEFDRWRQAEPGERR